MDRLHLSHSSKMERYLLQQISMIKQVWTLLKTCIHKHIGSVTSRIYHQDFDGGIIVADYHSRARIAVEKSMH
jgi:hypothetical protein